MQRFRDLPTVTSDGISIKLMANIELPGEIDAILESGAEGIGLFRSEFMYMNRTDWPGEDEQYEILRKVVDRMNGRPVTIRILDAGGDKLTTALGGSMPATQLWTASCTFFAIVTVYFRGTTRGHFTSGCAWTRPHFGSDGLCHF